jgi:hypothetical protein
MTKKVLVLIILNFTTGLVYGQIGGKRTFEFLETPNHAKVGGLGTVNVSAGEDLNMVNQNPALLLPEMDGDISLTISPYLAGIFNTQLNYARNFEEAGIFNLGVYFQSFGQFDGYDNTGNAEGSFSASNYNISLSHSKKQGIFNYGATLKLAGSQLPGNQQSALLLDLGGVYSHPEQDLNIGLVIKNAGFYLKKNPDEDRPLPFDIQLGGTFKPEFMPFRFSLTANRLYQYDLSYFEPIDEATTNNAFIEVTENAPSTFDKIFQHITVGTEILLGKSINIRAGYNHLLRQSLRGEQVAGAGGFTFGLLINTKKLNLAYSNAIYQVGGSAHFITLGTNFNHFIKKKS